MKTKISKISNKTLSVFLVIALVITFLPSFAILKTSKAYAQAAESVASLMVPMLSQEQADSQQQASQNLQDTQGVQDTQSVQDTQPAQETQNLSPEADNSQVEASADQSSQDQQAQEPAFTNED